MVKIMIVSIAIIIAVMFLTIYAISKGYAYEHKVDPLPDEKKSDDDNSDSDNKE
ncbi:YtzI protein [Halalkalibacillus sediminis]|uniref:YtzI protein n=1 Tax=Halalkalibacillus sediminis TaxID=2018042 RepID=A0A2I0QRV5_9BACI|nr:YtzI protein [Halalkalibacillus sediminis]PKR77066.1 YtzI protein [Halalkalibacillus sediminis]